MQNKLMKFDPATNDPKPYPSHAEQYREWHGQVAWLYNPWTGSMRDPRHIGTDVFGLLIRVDGEALKAEQAQQEPSKDIHEAITLLSAVFDAWENGTDCYDDFDGVSGSFIGKAFNLDDEIFKRCCDLLNRVNPPRNVSQAQQPIGEVQHYAAPANLPAYVNVKWYAKPPKNGAKVYFLNPKD